MILSSDESALAASDQYTGSSGSESGTGCSGGISSLLSSVMSLSESRYTVG